jgi:hypothetical protein
MSLQTLKGYRDVSANLPGATEKFVQDYSSLKEDLSGAERAINSLLETIESFKPLYGDQTPEGNITSNDSLVYFDTTNSPTSVTMYFNNEVGVKTGWVQIN